MKIQINGEELTVSSNTLSELLLELDHEPMSVATAVNQVFVPREQRKECQLCDNDTVDIIAPMSGG